MSYNFGAVLNTNVASIWASKNLLGAQSKLAASVERLSSGLRINRARDDAAGLGIANSLTAQINGANQGTRNLSDAISMVQTAEGAISAAIDMGQRILMLATQGANGTLGTAERGYIKEEVNQLLSAINQIGARTTFSGNKLLDVDADTGTVADNTAADDDIFDNSTASALFSMQISNSASDTVSLASKAFHSIGTDDNKGLAAVAIADADGDGTVESGEDLKSTAAAANLTSTTASDASAAFRQLQVAADGYIKQLTTQKSLLGAYQNQLEYTLTNITELSSNLSAARSRVIDTDYAGETAALTKGQILQQAATAMLAQANQMPNVILTLLK